MVGWFSQNHRTANPAREPHIIWQRGLSSLFPFPIVPRALSFSFSSASPQHKEASREERDITLNGATWRPKASENQQQLLLGLFFGSNSYPFMIYFSKWLIWLKIFRQSPFLQGSLSHWQLIKVMLSSQKCWVFLSHKDTEKMMCRTQRRNSVNSGRNSQRRSPRWVQPIGSIYVPIHEVPTIEEWGHRWPRHNWRKVKGRGGLGCRNQCS